MLLIEMVRSMCACFLSITAFSLVRVQSNFNAVFFPLFFRPFLRCLAILTQFAGTSAVVAISYYASLYVLKAGPNHFHHELQHSLECASQDLGK